MINTIYPKKDDRIKQARWPLCDKCVPSSVSFLTQQGMALFACLMILLVLSLLGISAMRMMTSQAQVVSGSLGAAISYSTGSSVINAAIVAAESDLDARVILPRQGEAPRTNCLAGRPGATTSMVDCSSADALADARGVTKAQVVVSTLDTDADTAAQAQARLAERVRRFGSMPGAQVEYFNFTAQGDVSALDIQSTQTQETFFPHL
jgi:Tfp pilus assembly protein PilX